MPNFRYTARDQRGKAVTGTLPAASSDALADELRRMGYFVTQAKEVGDGPGLAALELRFARVGFDDMVLFNVQLAKLISVGIPLVTSLATLSEQTDNLKLRAAVLDVSKAVEDVLKRMAAFLKRQAELRQQVMTAMTYPAILLAVGLGVIGFLLTGIIPKFMKIFVEAEVALPLPTRILHEISQVLVTFWPAALLVTVLGLVVLRMYRRTEAGKRATDHWVLRLPLLGDLLRKATIARWARTLETLFSSGVPVLESLSLAEETSGNMVIADACRTVAASVRQGGALAEPLKASRQFPPMVVQMVAVGESSGTLDSMLGEIADHYEELVRHGLKRLTTLLEPAFLLIMGGMVALIMASVLMPLFRMVNVIR
jgi:type IV pilus assembly protein PilC